MNNNHVSPVLRFAGFTDDWEQHKVSAIASDTRGGGTPATSNEAYWNGDIPWIQSSDLSEGQLFGVEPRKHISRDGLNNSATQLVPENSIAVVTRVGVGKLAFMPFPYTTSQDFLSLCKLQTEPFFTVYALYQMLQGELQAVQGTSIKGMTKDDLLSKLIIVPKNMTEQRQIGLYFSRLDNLITLHQRQYNRLLQIKKAMLLKLFPRPGKDVPEIRFSGFDSPWMQCKLGNLVQFSKGSGYSKSDLKKAGTPIILYGRLYTQYETVITDVDTFADEKPGSVYSRGGEVIVPASGETAEDIAIASVVDQAGVLLGGDLNIITPPDDIDSAFLAISISNGKPHADMAKMAQGKSVVHLHNVDLEKIDLVYPDYDEQTQISSFFRRLDDTIALHKSRLTVLGNLKKAMLQKMFPVVGRK